MRSLPRRSFKIVPGRYYETPKELWGFRSAAGHGSPPRIAREFLEAHADILGIDPEPLFRREPRILRGLGASHVILQQRWKRRRVHRAYVTVHIRRGDDRVYLVKSRAAPLDVLRAAPDARIAAERAVRIARARVPRHGRKRVIGKPELLWYPARRLLHPAWRVRVRRESPRAEYIVYVNARTGSVISRFDNLAAATGRGRVFLPNPMAGDPRFEPLDSGGRVRTPPPEAYVTVRLSGLRGNGFLVGARASTRITPAAVRKRDHDFRADWNRRGFEEVSAYYHVDRAVAYLESLGYRGSRRIFDKPVRINARGTPEDNSWYSPGERSLTFGLGDVDDAEDGETVLHELGHAVQDAICPDFGQSAEAAAMGEGFGDYFAASFFEDRKPPRYRLTVMSWDGAYYEGDPPCVRRLDSRHTYETFDHSPGDHEHENGEIWSAALWEVREALGREKADRAIVDSHFQLDGFTTFARGARAILDADRNLHHGAHRAALLDVFRRRGIGPLE
jgi:hypothetical protein